MLRAKVKRALLGARVPFRSRLLLGGWRAYERWVARGSRREAPRVGPSSDGQRPVPPRDLRVLVACEADQELFLRSGEDQMRFFAELLERNAIRVEDLSDVLDFGCGCGRLARWWPSGRGQLHGCDYNPRLVAWCQENLPAMRARASGLEPPLPYPRDSFDLIYALSVFTHLSEPLQTAWARELARVLRPGGALLFTASGAAYTDRLSPGELERFESGRLVTHFEEVSGTNMCAAYHPRRFVETRLLREFDLLEAIEPGHDPSATISTLAQDTYLARLPAPTASA